ncbi:hypothetical protein EJ04DRAFT_73850 [Polyplosphaeria fusca]|uniref:Methyltransferase domain-containing protein n=1 Tax=Polyplosphaeria fusca TaxID=682080 RepID=A0A9P4QL64_9PLEO|nr:hypothetical protein EJ04DRAFT_73850 [Polyplosphaeria fusca]
MAEPTETARHTELWDYPRLAREDPKKLPWYLTDIEDLGDETRSLFEDYSKIPPMDVEAHIKATRDRAFQIYPYPCLGRFDFLDFSISRSPHFNDIVQRIQKGDKYLDIGCCVGQDIRKLAQAGAPSENMYGSDLEQEFMNIGYDLFRDKSDIKATFIAANILDPDSDLRRLDGKIDIVHAASFFHLFSWEESVKACSRVAMLLKPQPGGIVVGRQIGHEFPGAMASSIHSDKKRFRHNADTFAKMWEEVGTLTGTKWAVEAKLGDLDLSQVVGDMREILTKGTRWLSFTVWRV